MEHTPEGARARAGKRVGAVGIAVNALLFLAKFLVGSASGSLAMIADAFNNLSDAGGSVVSYISFRIAAKPADRDHPFGHARIEYIASMIVSFLILSVGLSLGRDAVSEIVSPKGGAVFTVATVIVPAIAILVKLALAALNFTVGRRVDSAVLRAAAVDSLSDAVSTAAVLVSAIILRVSGVSIDAYVGLAVAALILVAGVRVLLETMNSILGEAPVSEVTDRIRALIAEYPTVLGVHDMLIHSYGHGHSFATLHAEVDGRGDVFAAHDTVDEIERRIHSELGIVCTVHMDPILIGDPLTDELRSKVEALASALDPALHVHDFRLVVGPTHSNLIFDVEVPFEMAMSDSEIVRSLCERISELDTSYYAVITVDRG